MFTLPSRDEGLSNALLEAMSCELPVITARVAGALDIVEEGISGFAYDPEDVPQLAHAFRQMFDCADQWDAMGSHGRQTVVEYADLKTIAGKLDQLYRELAES